MHSSMVAEQGMEEPKLGSKRRLKPMPGSAAKRPAVDQDEDLYGGCCCALSSPAACHTTRKCQCTADVELPTEPGPGLKKRGTLHSGTVT